MGLGVVDPLLVDLLALLSLSWPSDDLLFIWALRQSILSCVFLILLRGSKVSPALSSLFDLFALLLYQLPMAGGQFLVDGVRHLHSLPGTPECFCECCLSSTELSRLIQGFE